MVDQRMETIKLKRIVNSLKMFFDDTEDESVFIEGIRPSLVIWGGSNGPTALPLLIKEGIMSIVKNGGHMPGCTKKAKDAILYKEKLYTFSEFLDKYEDKHIKVREVMRQVIPSKKYKGKLVTKTR